MKMIYYIDKNISNLTINGVYDIINGLNTYVVIRNDVDEVRHYPLNWFITLEEYRNKKLIQLGI